MGHRLRRLFLQPLYDRNACVAEYHERVVRIVDRACEFHFENPIQRFDDLRCELALHDDLLDIRNGIEIQLKQHRLRDCSDFSSTDFSAKENLARVQVDLRCLSTSALYWRRWGMAFGVIWV